MDIFSAPFCFSGVRSTFGHSDDMMMMILIRERAYDSNIRKILKWFQKQSLWWEHRNILENCAIITLCWGETSSKFASCQNRVDSTWRACHGPSRVTKTSASWVNSSLRLHFFAQFFSKNSRLFLCIIDALNDEWWLSSERVHDNNIRKVIKHFQKQRVWREHHKIL